MHFGALPEAREPILNARLPTPTRLVSASGYLSEDGHHRPAGIPRYRRLDEALAAIDAEWAALGPGDVVGHGEEVPLVLREVVQIEDSHTYRGEHPSSYLGAPGNPWRSFPRREIAFRALFKPCRLDPSPSGLSAI